MVRAVTKEIEVDELLGATAEGIEELIGDLWFNAHLTDDDIRLPARKMLMRFAIDYSIERLWEFGLTLDMGPSEVAKKYPDNPILDGMKKLSELKRNYEMIVRKRYKQLKTLKNLTTRHLPNDKEMRAHFAKIVDYKAIPPFDEYETLRRGDKELIVEDLKDEIDSHFDVCSPHIQRVFKKAQIFKSASKYNAVRLKSVNPEAHARLEAEMQEEEW